VLIASLGCCVHCNMSVNQCRRVNNKNSNDDDAGSSSDRFILSSLVYSAQKEINTEDKAN